jgi:hypothetical protein
VAKKGDPKQTTFTKWGKVYTEEDRPPRDLSNIFSISQSYWDATSNRYPYEKPKTVMRKFVHHFARPGHLVFEGFAGTISCGLAALTCGVNLVAVDNNGDTKRFLRDLYRELNRGIYALESLDSNWSNIDEAAYMFVSDDMDQAPTYSLLAPVEFHDNIPIIPTEDDPFSTSQTGIRTANFQRQQTTAPAHSGPPVPPATSPSPEPQQGEEEVHTPALSTAQSQEPEQGGTSQSPEYEQVEEEVHTPITPITPQKRFHESDSDENRSTNSFEDPSPAY